MFIAQRTVEVQVERLREALGASGCASMIETVRVVGYRLARPAPVGA